MKTNTNKWSGERDSSPYTPQTAEDAIAHLERILSADGVESLFPRAYWCARLRQLSATRGLTPLQLARIARLTKLLESFAVAA